MPLNSLRLVIVLFFIYTLAMYFSGEAEQQKS